ncbi:MAG: 3-dehydroquinate synthase [Buchnera aphidicola (Schlechtendalia peitan)]
MLQRIKVVLNHCTYYINIGPSLFELDNILSPLQSGDKIMLISNDVIFNIWGNDLCSYLKKIEVQVDYTILPDGECSKNINSIEHIISKLLKNLHGRDTILIALGGGVIGDITGFVASIYQRGIKFIQIPTTLLSQIDASIGGKTSINHVLGKNMIGSFWQPVSVIINLDYLSTLPKKQLISGMAEVIKYAIIFDSDFFNWLEENIDSVLMLDHKKLSYCVRKCCEIKKTIVEKDEREDNDRALLNLGHTYGHAIETYLGYGKWLHGEAVSVGMVMASETSVILGLLSISEKNRIVNLLSKIGLPTHGPKNMNFISYFENFLRDKKVLSGILRLILPVSIGKAVIYSDVKKSTLELAIENCK